MTATVLKRQSGPKKRKSSAQEANTGEDFFKLVQEAGWKFRRNGETVVCYPPEGEPLTFGLVGGDYRSLQNHKSRLKRAGLFTLVDELRTEQREIVAQRLADDREKIEQQIKDIEQSNRLNESGEAVGRRDQALFDLVERCKAVGWRTRTVGTDQSHIVITPPAGKRPITIACGSGVSNYATMMLSKLNKAGLAEAEAAKAEQDNRDRAEIPTTDQAGHTAEPAKVPLGDAPAVSTGNGPDCGIEEGIGICPGGYATVDGVDVAEWTWALTPIKAKDRQAVELLLEDATVRYGCIVGDFIGPNWQSVAKHRKAEHPELRSPSARARDERLRGIAELNRTRILTPSLFTQEPATTNAQSNLLELKAVNEDYATRLRRLMGTGRVFTQADNAIIEAAGNFQAGDYEILSDDDDVYAGDEPTGEDRDSTTPPLLSLVTAADDKDTAGPASAAAATDDGPAAPPPVTARVVTPAPPTARVGIAQMAASISTSGRSTRQSALAGTAMVSAGAEPAAAAGAGLDLAAMVDKLRRFAQLEAENRRLRAELDELKATADKATRELSFAAQQGQALADQCISKDNTIRRLRQELQEQQRDVAAARELQALMANLIGGTQAA